jgi:hypothetical protein
MIVGALEGVAPSHIQPGMGFNLQLILPVLASVDLYEATLA